MISVEWTGIPEMQEAFARLQAQALPAMGIALGREGDAILTESQALVPVLTGALRNSAVREGPEQSRLEVIVILRYGHYGAVPYALIVHEDLTMRHPHGGQARYLAMPFFAATDGMVRRLSDDFWPYLRPRG